MKPRPPLPGGPYLVVGLARSGVAAALALRARGEEVIGCDAGARTDPRLAEAARKAFRGRRRSSPRCVRRRHCRPRRDAHQEPRRTPSAPVVVAARARGVPVLGELELAWRLVGNEFVAVTGTNGKTTTTEWIGHIHREAALPVAVVGNVGTAATLAGRPASPADTTVVCEVSSFQLEDTEAFAPEVGGAAQPRARPPRPPRDLRRLRGRQAADLRQPGHRRRRRGRRRPGGRGPRRLRAAGAVRRRRPRPAVAARRRALVGRGAAGRGDEISLPGEHNRANAMAAAAACLARGIDAASGRARAVELSPASPTGSS